METSTGARSSRLVWPDVAKGLCILLVVLHHVLTKHYVVALPDAHSVIGQLWTGITNGLKPVRMPVFFAISGFFAASAMGRPWSASTRRVLSSYYLYAVWLLIFMGVYTLERTTPANRTTDVLDLGGDLLWASTSMWFLYALAAYFVVAKALSRWPVPTMVVAVLLSISVSWLGVEETNRFSVLEYFAFFVVAAYRPTLLRSIAQRELPLVPLAVGFFSVVALLAWAPLSVATFVAGVAGVPLGITAAVRLAPTRLGAPLAWVGRRTLRIYVLHLVVLAVIVHLPLALADGSGVASSLLALVYPLLAAGLVVTSCFGLHALLVAVGAGWLFAMPPASAPEVDLQTPDASPQAPPSAPVGRHYLA